MALRDQRGNPVSTTSSDALDGLERAIELLHGYHVDPLAEIDRTLERHPDFVMGHCFRAGLIATVTDKQLEPELQKSVEAAERLAPRANDRERGHIAACRAWLDGDFERATDLWGRVLFDHPRDSLALQLAHVGDFYNGFSTTLRDRVARVLPAWSPAVPGYGYVLGMYAFGLEESGDYTRAERAGREAVGMNPRDGWAVHAVVHVLEMQGLTGAGIGFLEPTANEWSSESMFAYHNWWHLALFHLDRGDIDRALAVYDRNIRPTNSDVALEMIDGSALLWRLQLKGVDVGGRWAPLADLWQTRAGHGYYAFNDVHAVMSFVGAGRDEAAREQLETLERAAAGSGTNAMMSREVGLPLARALVDFGRGRYREAIDGLLPLRTKAQRFGGSHAQRDVIAWTLLEAALRAREPGLARALSAERLALKPESPLNRWWADRAATLAAERG
jgi:tetratricopeptide (TPR) repeat protein